MADERDKSRDDSTRRLLASDETKRVPHSQSPKLAAIRNVRHGFFGRLGGHSRTPFESLNVGLQVGDPLDSVVRNRASILETMHVPQNRWHQGLQVHGSDVIKLDEQNLAELDERPRDLRADGLATGICGETLAVYSADCVPILLAERHGLGVAAVHAGWRGTGQRIAITGVRTLTQMTASSSADIVAALGPAIGPCCFCVGREVLDALAETLGKEPVALATVRDPDGDETNNSSRQIRLDLWALNAYLLELAGVPKVNIDILRLCTMCRVDCYFSYRKEQGKTGRQAAVIARVS